MRREIHACSKRRRRHQHPFIRVRFRHESNARNDHTRRRGGEPESQRIRIAPSGTTKRSNAHWPRYQVPRHWVDGVGGRERAVTHARAQGSRWLISGNYRFSQLGPPFHLTEGTVRGHTETASPHAPFCTSTCGRHDCLTLGLEEWATRRATLQRTPDRIDHRL